VAYSPDGELLVGAAGANMRTIPIWNAASGAQRMFLPKEAICFSAAFSPDGQLVAAVASTNDVCVWDVATGELRRKLTHPLRPNRVAFCRDSRLLATVSLDSKVRLWDVLTNEPPVEIRGHVGDVWCAVFSPDGRRLATGAGYKGRGEIRIREAPLWEQRP